MATFYVLCRNYSKAEFAFLESEPGELLPAAMCPKCGEKIALPVDSPSTVYTTKRTLYGDLITDGISVAVTRRVVEAYDEAGVTGLEIRRTPLLVQNASVEYFLAVPAPTCTLIDESASRIVIHEVRGCEFCRVMSLDKIERLVINEATWRGQDVFMCGSVFSEIIATERFSEFVLENRFTNFRFINSDAYSFDYRGR